MGGMKREGSHEVLVITVDDTVGIFLHLLEGKDTSDGGHSVDVGNIDCLFGRKVGSVFGIEGGVGFLAGGHVIAEEEITGVGVEFVGFAVLVVCSEGFDLASEFVLLG